MGFIKTGGYYRDMTHVGRLLRLVYCGSTGVFLLLRIFSKLFGAPGSPSLGSLLNL